MYGEFRFDDEGKEAHRKLYSRGEYFEGNSNTNAGSLREAMPEYVYVNGLRKKSITLKNGDIFAMAGRNKAETFVFVSGREYARLNSGINELHRKMSIGVPLPNYGIIDIGERFLYEYVIQDGAPLVLNRIPWTEENAQFATEWREYVDEQIKAYESTRAVSWDIDTFRRRLKDYLYHNDATSIGGAAERLTDVGRLALGYLQQNANDDTVFEGYKHSSQAYPDTLVEESGQAS